MQQQMVWDVGIIHVENVVGKVRYIQNRGRLRDSVSTSDLGKIINQTADYHSVVGLSERNEMKKILDACCGSRMFWFDRENQDVLFADNRELETTLCDGRALLVKPDIKMDFREMPFPDNTFKIVVFDPPHLKQAGSESWLAKKYGVLPKEWKPYLKAGFLECMRVLEPDGILVFKWNEEQIKLNDVLKEFEKEPLLGDQRGKTRWILFMK